MGRPRAGSCGRPPRPPHHHHRGLLADRQAGQQALSPVGEPGPLVVVAGGSGPEVAGRSAEAGGCQGEGEGRGVRLRLHLAQPSLYTPVVLS